MQRQLLVTLPQTSAPGLQHAGSTPRSYRGRSGYKTSQRVKRTAARLARDYGLRRIDEWPIQALDVHCVVFEIPPELGLAAVTSELALDPRVESVQPMGLFEVLAGPARRQPDRTGYDDPFFELQHAFASMQLEDAHTWVRGEGIRVAVVDTGIDLTHPELRDRVSGAEDFVDSEAQHFTSDIHGTAIAGVIASAANNGIGIVGVAPAVEILALKACWPREAGSVAAFCTSFTLAKAISFAIGRRPEVLNLSLAGPPDPLLSRLLSRAIERGIIVVTAADPERRGGFPAGLDGVIVVSDAGTPTPSPSGDRVRAPGEEIFTTMPYGAYDFLSGSSLAAAHVSGLVALLLEAGGRLAVEEVLALLRETGGTTREGVNGCRALARLRGAGSCPPLRPAAAL